MSFPAYADIKDSGVDWLGKVPSDWTITSLKRVSSICYGIGEPPKYQEDGTRLVRATNVSRGSISDEGMVYVDPTHIPEQRIVWLAEGDIIVVRSGAYTGDSAIIPDGYGEAIAGFDMVMRLHGAFPKFVQYALLSNYVKDFQLELKRMRAAQPHLNAEELGECVFVAPCLDEQKAISSFLDAETSKIDGLVSEQRRLIELLKEKRQAVISHAVTKGLNPNAPMKPSGIQWLGDVPQHWEVYRMGVLYSDTSESGKDDLPVLQVSIHDGVSDRELTEDESDRKITRIEDKSKYRRVLPNDLVYNMMRAWQGGFGTVKVEGMVSPAYVVARPKRAFMTQYVEHLFRTPQAIEQMRRYSHGVTDFRLRLYWANFKNVRVALPPVDEQLAICDHIEKTTTRFDALREEAERAIELLQERRTALISAAVTGKIDVRGFAPREAT